MSALAESFVNFLAQVRASNGVTGAAKIKMEREVAHAAQDLMGKYLGYRPADPEDQYDAATIKLIEKIDDFEALAALIVNR